MSMDAIISDTCHCFAILSHREYTYSKSKKERDILTSQYTNCSKLTKDEIHHLCYHATQGTLTIDATGKLRGFSLVTSRTSSKVFTIQSLCGDTESIDMALEFYTMVREPFEKSIGNPMEIFTKDDHQIIKKCQEYGYELDTRFQSEGGMREVRLLKK